jgi:hypothetical protein
MFTTLRIQKTEKALSYMTHLDGNIKGNQLRQDIENIVEQA